MSVMDSIGYIDEPQFVQWVMNQMTSDPSFGDILNFRIIPVSIERIVKQHTHFDSPSSTVRMHFEH